MKIRVVQLYANFSNYFISEMGENSRIKLIYNDQNLSLVYAPMIVLQN